MEKVKDMASTAKEKVKEGTAKVQGKAGEATARTHGEKMMAREEAKAKQADAKGDLHHEKAEHRAEAARHGAVGTHVPLTGPHGRHHPVGAATHDPAYPTTGTYPASEKYL